MELDADDKNKVRLLKPERVSEQNVKTFLPPEVFDESAHLDKQNENALRKKEESISELKSFKTLIDKNLALYGEIKEDFANKNEKQMAIEIDKSQLAVLEKQQQIKKLKVESLEIDSLEVDSLGAFLGEKNLNKFDKTSETNSNENSQNEKTEKILELEKQLEEKEMTLSLQKKVKEKSAPKKIFDFIEKYSQVENIQKGAREFFSNKNDEPTPTKKLTPKKIFDFVDKYSQVENIKKGVGEIFSKKNEDDELTPTRKPKEASQEAPELKKEQTTEEILDAVKKISDADIIQKETKKEDAISSIEVKNKKDLKEDKKEDREKDLFNKKHLSSLDRVGDGNDDIIQELYQTNKLLKFLILNEPDRMGGSTTSGGKSVNKSDNLIAKKSSGRDGSGIDIDFDKDGKDKKDKDKKDKNKKTKPKGGLASKVARGAKTVASKAGGVAVKAGGLIAKGAGALMMGTEGFAGVAALASNPIGWAIGGALLAGAATYGVYHLMIDDDSEAVFDQLEEQGAVSHSLFGESDILDWGKIYSLNDKSLDALIRYDDWSKENLTRFKTILNVPEEMRGKIITQGISAGVISVNSDGLAVVLNIKSFQNGITNLIKNKFNPKLLLPILDKRSQEILKSFLNENKPKKVEKNIDTPDLENKKSEDKKPENKTAQTDKSKKDKIKVNKDKSKKSEKLKEDNTTKDILLKAMKYTPQGLLFSGVQSLLEDDSVPTEENILKLTETSQQGMPLDNIKSNDINIVDSDFSKRDKTKPKLIKNRVKNHSANMSKIEEEQLSSPELLQSPESVLKGKQSISKIIEETQKENNEKSVEKTTTPTETSVINKTIIHQSPFNKSTAKMGSI